MTNPRSSWAATLALAAGLLAMSFAALAAPGNTLVVTQVASLSGSNGAELGQGLRVGAQVVFDDINARGGVSGQRIRFVSLDDVYDPAQTVALTRESISRDDPIALINYRGTANTLALMKSGVLETAGIPLVGTLTGAPAVHESPNIFHTRTSYPDEVRKLMQALAAIGHKRIAIIHSNDAFGTSGLQAAESAAKAAGVLLERITFEQKGAASKSSIESATAAAAQGQQSAVLLVAVGEPALDLLDGLRTKIPGLPLYALSVVSPAAVVARVGETRARGIGFSQVFPFPFSSRTKLVAEYTRLLAKYAPGESPGYFSLEGFINAKVLIEALQKAGPAPTRQRLLSALRSMERADVGEMTFNFARTGVSASAFSELVVLGPGGRLLR